MARIAEKFKSVLLAGGAGVCATALIGFPSVPSAMSSQTLQPAQVNCKFAAVSYAEGSVIHGDRVPEQMCVAAPYPPESAQGPGYFAEWVRVNKEARERGSNVVALPDGVSQKSLNFSCQPKPGVKKDSCGCEHGDDFAPGSAVRSSRGAVRCDQGEWRPLPACVADDKEYAEGTVIRTADGTERMCVRILTFPFDRQSRDTHLDWVRTSTEIRERSNHSTVVILDPVLCKPAPAKSPGLCGCEGFSDFGPKSIMQSANGPIRCEDGEWRPVAKDSGTK